MKKTLPLVTMGLLIALTVALTELSKFMPFSDIVRISFGFVAVATAALLLGPISGGIVAALADILSFFMFPTGAYLPGLTLSALLAGVIYGLVLYKRKPSILRSAIAATLVCLLIDAGLNTIILYLFIPFFAIQGFQAFFITRIIKSLVMIPVQTFIIYALWRFFIKQKLFGKFLKS